jgi:hypothetical protein
MVGIENLAAYQRTVQRIHGQWAPFLAKRQERLQQQIRHGEAAGEPEPTYSANNTGDVGAASVDLSAPAGGATR